MIKQEDYYQQLENVNKRLSASLMKYGGKSENEKWRKNFLNSLQEIKKMQAKEAILGSGRMGSPFDGLVNQVRAKKNEEQRNAACSTLSSLNAQICQGSSPHDKVCFGLSKALNSLACSMDPRT